MIGKQHSTENAKVSHEITDAKEEQKKIPQVLKRFVARAPVH
jgi:hypothetical protein